MTQSAENRRKEWQIGRTVWALLVAALVAPAPVAVIVFGLSGEIIALLLYQVFGFAVALVGAVLVGLPVFFYAERRHIRSYGFYAVAGLLGGQVFTLLFLLLSLYNANEANLIPGFVLMASASACSWTCASVFWLCRIKDGGEA